MSEIGSVRTANFDLIRDAGWIIVVSHAHRRPSGNAIAHSGPLLTPNTIRHWKSVGAELCAG